MKGDLILAGTTVVILDDQGRNATFYVGPLNVENREAKVPHVLIWQINQYVASRNAWEQYHQLLLPCQFAGEGRPLGYKLWVQTSWLKGKLQRLGVQVNQEIEAQGPVVSPRAQQWKGECRTAPSEELQQILSLYLVTAAAETRQAWQEADLVVQQRLRTAVGLLPEGRWRRCILQLERDAREDWELQVGWAVATRHTNLSVKKITKTPEGEAGREGPKKYICCKCNKTLKGWLAAGVHGMVGCTSSLVPEISMFRENEPG